MKKYLLLLVSLYSLFCWGQRKTHLQEMKLNGEVKYLKVYEYNNKELNFVKEYFFNRQGNIERNNNYQKGQLSSEFIYHYDDQGRFSFYEMNFYGDYAKEGKIVFSYNRKGDAFQEEYYENDKLIQYTQNKYDNKHHIILSTIYREEKELSHTEFVYNDIDQLVEVSNFNNKNELQSTLKNYYDSLGNLSKSDTYNAKGDKTTSREMEYDAYNNVIKDKIILESKRSLEYNYRYKYDSHQNYITKEDSNTKVKKGNFESVYLKEKRQIEYY